MSCGLKTFAFMAFDFAELKAFNDRMLLPDCPSPSPRPQEYSDRRQDRSPKCSLVVYQPHKSLQGSMCEPKGIFPPLAKSRMIVTNDLSGSVPGMRRYHLPVPVMRLQLILNK